MHDQIVIFYKNICSMDELLQFKDFMRLKFLKIQDQIFPLIILFSLISRPLQPQKMLSWNELNIISIDSLKRHVEFLGNDTLEGRGTGTPGEFKAAQYLTQQLKKLKLRPLGPNNSYFQPVPMHGSTPLPESRLLLHSSDSIFTFQLKRDYLLYKTGDQTLIPQPVPLVFVGYGIIAPEFDYDDYHSLDVVGKIVVFLAGEPPSSNVNYFNGMEPSIYASPEIKQRISISRGALGSIMIPSPREGKKRGWRQWVDTFEFEDISLAYSVSGNLALVMNPNAARTLFLGSGFSLEQIYEMDILNKIKSFPLNIQMSFKGVSIRHDFFAMNVIGLLEGIDYKKNDKYLLLSAHYDHLGIGRSVRGDSIYNGVADNALGVAAVLEIARAFKVFIIQPKHSIIFLFTTGEEKGLLGSTYYVDNPPVPLFKTIANINIDGLAMFDTFNDIIGVGIGFSTLSDHLNQVARKLNLKISPVPHPFLDFESFAHSDQLSFAKAGIPAILIAEGLGYQNFSSTEGLTLFRQWMGVPCRQTPPKTAARQMSAGTSRRSPPSRR